MVRFEIFKKLKKRKSYLASLKFHCVCPSVCNSSNICVKFALQYIDCFMFWQKSGHNNRHPYYKSFCTRYLLSRHVTYLRPNAFIRNYRRNAPHGFLFEIKVDRIYSRFVTLCEPPYVVCTKQFRVLHSFVLRGH